MDEGRKLAFDAIGARLAQQDQTLGNLRNRATWMLTVAALIGSLATGLGLVNTGNSPGQGFPHWAAYSLLGIITSIGFLVLYIYWPVPGFMFGPDGTVILQRLQDGAGIDTVLQDITGTLADGRNLNNAAIERRMNMFKVASLLFIAESVLFILAIALD